MVVIYDVSYPPRPPSLPWKKTTHLTPLLSSGSRIHFLTSYGFVLPNNPYGGLDYWVRVPPTDPGFQWKQALLDGHPLTAAQAYDFSGTVRTGGRYGYTSGTCSGKARTADWKGGSVLLYHTAFVDDLLGKIVIATSSVGGGVDQMNRA